MPRYFFHLLHPVHAPVRDYEGLEFEDNAAARREAIASLGDLISDALSADPAPYHVSVQIAREGFGVIDVLSRTVSASNASRPS
jgi:hypothetical protein